MILWQHCFGQKAPRQRRRPLLSASEGAAELCVLVTAAGVRDATEEEEEEECQRRREGEGSEAPCRRRDAVIQASCQVSEGGKNRNTQKL